MILLIPYPRKANKKTNYFQKPNDIIKKNFKYNYSTYCRLFVRFRLIRTVSVKIMSAK